MAAATRTSALQHVARKVLYCPDARGVRRTQVTADKDGRFEITGVGAAAGWSASASGAAAIETASRRAS